MLFRCFLDVIQFFVYVNNYLSGPFTKTWNLFLYVCVLDDRIVDNVDLI